LCLFSSVLYLCAGCSPAKPEAPSTGDTPSSLDSVVGGGDTRGRDSDPEVGDSDSGGRDSGGRDSAPKGRDSVPSGDTDPPPPFELACEGDIVIERAMTLDADDLRSPADWGVTVMNQGPGLAVGDLDGDGWLDLVFAHPVANSSVFINDRAGGLAPSVQWMSYEDGPLGSAYAAALEDIDGDGDMDLLLIRPSGQPDQIYYSGGEGFERRVDLPDSEGESKTASFADVDGDGDLDLFTAGFVTDPDVSEIEAGEQRGEGNHLYLQEDGAFAQASERLPAEIHDALTYQGAWLDVEGDGDLDLYITNDHGALLTPNHLALNDGAGHFTLSEGCYCNLAIEGMGAAVSDVNDDGLPDLYLTDWGPDHFLQNLGDGGFVESTSTVGLEETSLRSAVSWGAIFGDFNQDTYDDLAVAFGQSVNLELSEDLSGQIDLLYLREPAGGFLERGAELGFRDDGAGRSVVVADLDRDGHPDLITAGRLFLHVSRITGGCPPGVTLALEDTASRNTRGVGARVDFQIADRVATRWVLPGSTYSSSAHELYLGSGGYPAIDRVTVTWPDGRVTGAVDLATGQRVVLRPD